MSPIPTLPEVIYHRAVVADSSHAPVFRMVDEHGSEECSITWSQLHDEAMRLAALIRAQAGDRVMLMYPQGLEFVVAFVACMYAQVVAVPVNPPRKNQTFTRLVSILEDAQCALVLSTPEIREASLRERDELKRFEPRWRVAAQAQGIAPWLQAPPPAEPDLMALLQYTSGSTGQPKGRSCQGHSWTQRGRRTRGAGGRLRPAHC